MKKLRIIVPKDSALDSYLAGARFVYDKIVFFPNSTCYKMNISSSHQLIEFLVSKFCLKNFSICCYDGAFTFRVRS